MVRTKADSYVKASVKATRKSSILSPGSSKGSPRNGKIDKYAGGNPYYPRPTPSWQKPITNFFGSSGSVQVSETQREHEIKNYSKMMDPLPSGSKDHKEQDS